MGEALNKFVEEARHLSETFDSHTVFSIGGWDISQYTLYMFFILALVLMVVLVGGRKLQLVPKNKFLNTVEYGYDFVNTSIGQDVLIPGAKATTGTISITWALAAISFVYFNFYGLKTLGVFGYIKSLVPSGVPGPMVPVIWFLEFFSMVIRVLTLAVRLYGNMLAGHMVLAVFSLATTVFLQQAVFSMDFVTALPAVAWFVLLVLMYAMECLVAFLQAYVFTILSASYIGMAVHPH